MHPDPFDQKCTANPAITEIGDVFLSSKTVRQIDADAVDLLGIPSLLLMENAARGLTLSIQDRCRTGQIFVVCGRGNNGGDGLAAVRLLAADGFSSRCCLVADHKSLTPDAAANLRFLNALQFLVTDAPSEEVSDLLRSLTEDDWIVDALLGTGIHGEVREPYRSLIHEINESKARVLAVDIPSGLDADSGQPCGICVNAHHTVTFACKKTCFSNPESVPWTGTVEVRPIGLPASWIARYCHGIRNS